jgi:hypothetical protein
MICSLLYSIQGNSGTHPTSRAMGAASSFLIIQHRQHEANFHPIHWLRMHEALLHSPIFPIRLTSKSKIHKKNLLSRI